MTNTTTTETPRPTALEVGKCTCTKCGPDCACETCECVGCECDTCNHQQ